MTPVRKKRLRWIVGLVSGVGVATALGLAALQQNINLFYTPSQIAAGEAPHGARIRAGGMVQAGSLKRTPDSLALRFSVTDGARSLVVRYQGILPDLFREGQGVVALGRIDPDGTLQADEVLAKHDENYMPPEVTQALKKSGAAGPLARGAKELDR